MRVDVGGHSLEYDLQGTGPEVVTLLHGIAGHRGVWRRQVEALAPHHRVLAWDLRAHGGSDAPSGPWTLDDLSADLGALLDALEIPAAHVVGHSGGGVVGLHFALRYPERTRSLVLLGTASEANARAAAWYERIAAAADAGGGRAALTELGLADRADAIAPDGPGFAKMARCMATLHERPLTPRLGELRCPVTIAVGSADFIGPGGSVIMHRAIAGSRLFVVDGSGHELHLEDPDVTSRRIAETVASAAPAA